MAETSRHIPVMVGIASIPERADSLEQTLASLAPQADRIFLSLNGYLGRPDFLRRFPNVTATVRPVNGGDAEKYADVDDWEGIVATCDDDLLYPPDYIARLRSAIETYGPRTMVGFHGGKTLGWNGSHVAATHKRIACLGDLAVDDPDVNVLGTGALAFHTAGVPVWRDVFRNANMADVHMACHARELGIPMVALEHRGGWLKDIGSGRGIYESNRDHDGSPRDTCTFRERELGRFDWTVPAARPHVRVSISTCERPEQLGELLLDLEREAAWLDLEVAVYEDPSAADYGMARALCAERGWTWNRMPERLGRIRYWELVNRELADTRDSTADWFLFLPDDVRLLRHAIPRAISTWNRLVDPATLTLWRLHSLEGKTNWTGKPAVQHADASEVFHVDGLYLCRRETMEAFGFRCPNSVPTRLGGSGVGRVLSLALDRQGKRMYRVDRSLVACNDRGVSVMNPAERLRHPAVAL